MTSLPHISTPLDDHPVFFRTSAGSRLHLPDCPHLVESTAHVAGDADALDLPVCGWSAAQIEGHGREHFDTVEDAMRRIGVAHPAHEEIVQGLRFVVHDDVYVVHSLTYAALRHVGRIVAGFGKTYYWVGDTRINLPDYVATSRDSRSAQKAYGDICPVHFEAMSLTGECGSCL